MPSVGITQLLNKLWGRYLIANNGPPPSHPPLTMMTAQMLSSIAYIKYAFGNTTFVSNGQTYTVSQLCDALVASPPTPSTLSSEQVEAYMAAAYSIPMTPANPTGLDVGMAVSTLEMNIVARYMLQFYGQQVPPAVPSDTLSSIVAWGANEEIALYALNLQYAPPNTFTPQSYAQITQYVA
jgi:hypothetical protein